MKNAGEQTGRKVSFDPVDQIMDVMSQAFDPAYGEAWNRRQISDALLLPNCHYLLLDEHGEEAPPGSRAAGFVLSRQAADEEELLLIAVCPRFRRKGVASALLEQLVGDLRRRGISRLFLEMREGNPAENLYRKFGFDAVGRRPSYYNRGEIKGIDAITFALVV